MITRFVLSTIALLVFILPCALSAELRESKTREERELHSAEQTIEISLAAMSAPAGQDLCSRSPISCVKPDAIETSLARASSEETLLGDAVAGTVKYAPPEQMGELRGVKPGPIVSG